MVALWSSTVSWAGPGMVLVVVNCVMGWSRYGGLVVVNCVMGWSRYGGLVVVNCVMGWSRYGGLLAGLVQWSRGRYRFDVLVVAPGMEVSW
jgi:hypothetical protein